MNDNDLSEMRLINLEDKNMRILKGYSKEEQKELEEAKDNYSNGASNLIHEIAGDYWSEKMNNLKLSITSGLIISFFTLVFLSIVIGTYAIRIFGVLLLVGLLLLSIINLIQTVINFHHKKRLYK